MANKKIAIPYVSEATIYPVTNSTREPLDIICEGPFYDVPKEVEVEVTNENGEKVKRKEIFLEQKRDVQELGTIAPLDSEAFRSTITADGKCVWRMLK